VIVIYSVQVEVEVDTLVTVQVVVKLDVTVQVVVKLITSFVHDDEP
jgi:hypothetical protein